MMEHRLGGRLTDADIRNVLVHAFAALSTMVIPTRERFWGHVAKSMNDLESTINRLDSERGTHDQAAA